MEETSIVKKGVNSPAVIFKSLFWFAVGAGLGLFLLVSFFFIVFQKIYADVVYPGVMINGVNFGGKTKEDVESFFSKKNSSINDIKFTFRVNDDLTTVSAKELDYGYNTKLLSVQAYSIGRSKDVLSNLSLILQAYLNGINLLPSYYYSEKKLDEILLPLSQKIKIEPIDALFTFQDGKVIAFRPSSDGQELETDKVKKEISTKAPELILIRSSKNVILDIPIKILKPKISTDQANQFGIKELISTGTSLFRGSIQGRIFNITLASARLNGILVAPNEVFSFDKALGDVSAFTGYQQAYIIQGGRTVLGDGGGVCQVSTTFFRAILNAGLPVIERNAHAYRVGYYEQDSPPGLDATIYTPSVDLKFKNDTGNYILIQSAIDPIYERLTFYLYGTKDERLVTMSKPVITSETPPPAPLYQDDPALSKGITKQVDFSAWGANVYFTRIVTKNGKTIISDKFVSNYKPWQAIYLRGTKE